MEDGGIHNSDLTNGNVITDIGVVTAGVKLHYLY